MHTDAFRLAANTTFGIWVFVAAMVCLCHYFYRIQSHSPEDATHIIARILYAAFVLILFVRRHSNGRHTANTIRCSDTICVIYREDNRLYTCSENSPFAIRPMCPKGLLIESFKVIALTAGVLFIARVLPVLHTEKFLVFANWDFAAALFSFWPYFFAISGTASLPKCLKERRTISSQVLYAVVVGV